MHHLHFNHLAILVAAVIQFFLGALWYSLFFAKPWMALTGHTPGERPKGAAVAMISSFVGGLILSFVLAHVVLWSGATTVGWGLIIGFICWLGFIAAPLFAETIYEQRSYKLFAINSGYWLVALLASGCVLAVWQ
jgi:Na+/melibiose symporter-like transporter